MKKKKWFLIAFVILVVVLLAVVPIPYVLEMPGSAEEVTNFIHVENGESEKEGSFRVMTVSTMPATPLLALQALLPHVDLVENQQIYGDTPSAEYFKVQEYNMEQARNAATVVAYKAAGATVSQNFDGVYVMSVVEDSDFSGKLQVGDIVKKINDQSFESANGFINAIRQMEVGDSVTITYERNGVEDTATGNLRENPDTQAPMIGISLVSHSTVDATPAVTFDPHGVSGPSAGLMFTLEMYNQLNPGNLKQGQIIAGTGTMDEEGRVGRIGGIDKKVVAAIRAGATVFLAPDDEITSQMRERNPEILSNYDDAVKTAKSMHSSIKIYPVKTFDDAIKILENL